MLSAGDHIVSMDDLYGGTNRFLRKVADRMNIKTTFVDARDPENVEKAIQENTKVIKYANVRQKLSASPFLRLARFKKEKKGAFIIHDDCCCFAVDLGRDTDQPNAEAR